MPCNCGTPPPVAASSGCAGSSGTSSDYGDISGMQGGIEKFCFKCTTFWVIIAVLFFLMLAGSGRRG